MTIKQLSRHVWIKRQLSKCAELLGATLSDSNRILVLALEVQFKEDLGLVQVRRDDGETDVCC